jgi:hypothetical protein
MSSGVVFLKSTPGARSNPPFRKTHCTKAEQYIELSRARRLWRFRSSVWRSASNVPTSSRREGNNEPGPPLS